jgi:hypothetical protein
MGRAQSFARLASPSSGLNVPGVRTQRPAVRPTPMGPLPSWASSFLRRSLHSPRHPDLAAIPPWASDGLRACAPQPPRPSGVFDSERPGSTPRAERPLQGSFPILKELALSTDTPAAPARAPKRPSDPSQAPSTAYRILKERVLRGPRRAIPHRPTFEICANSDPPSTGFLDTSSVTFPAGPPPHPPAPESPDPSREFPVGARRTRRAPVRRLQATFFRESCSCTAASRAIASGRRASRRRRRHRIAPNAAPRTPMGSGSALLPDGGTR